MLLRPIVDQAPNSSQLTCLWRKSRESETKTAAILMKSCLSLALLARGMCQLEWCLGTFTSYIRHFQDLLNNPSRFNPQVIQGKPACSALCILGQNKWACHDLGVSTAPAPFPSCVFLHNLFLTLVTMLAWACISNPCMFTNPNSALAVHAQPHVDSSHTGSTNEHS